MTRFSTLLRFLLLTIATLTAVIGATFAASGAEGYWRFQGYDLSPKQDWYDEVARNTPPGRVYEVRSSGAFQAEYAGKGSIELFFKYDDVDHHVFTISSTYTFGAGQEMSVLRPGQKITMSGSVSVDGTDPSASAMGSLWVNNGDNLFYIDTPRRQQKSADGFIVVPGGSPSDSLRVSATGGLSGGGGALHVTIAISYTWVEGSPPPDTDTAAPGSEILGSQIDVVEIEGWTGTWVRRPGTDTFDAIWQNINGAVASDVIHVVGVNGRDVVLQREGLNGSYSGTVSADGRSIQGTATWYPSGATWSGTISNGNSIVVLPPDDSDVSSIADDGKWDTPTDPSSAELFTDNWNVATCDRTDTATLDIARPLHLDRFELWMKWSTSEGSAPYRVTFEGTDIGGGILHRGECDPIQGEWCVGADTPDVDLSEGQYDITINHEAICQNTGSNGEGFIRAWGR